MGDTEGEIVRQINADGQLMCRHAITSLHPTVKQQRSTPQERQAIIRLTNAAAQRRYYMLSGNLQ
jgi:hypothetical protein